MRKLLGVLGVLIFCILCARTVKADVIWEPDDSFYRKHAEECHYVNRLYTANGPDGVVVVYRSPESPQVIDKWENGYQVSIAFTYEDSDGIVWGVYDNGGGKCGWMPMDYMEVVYDSISFAEEYAEDLAEQSGELDEKYGSKDILFWKYPGSQICYLVTVGDYMPGYSRVYTDEKGNRWGNVGYYYGYKNVWVCIDRPEADFEELYPEGAPLRGVEEEQENKDALQSVGRIVPKVKGSVVAAAVIMVLLTVAVTAGLLMTLKHRK